MTFFLLGVSAEVPVIATDTAILILVVVGLALLAKTVFSLRAEVNALKRSAPANGTPSAVSSGSPNMGVPAKADGEISPQIRAAIAAAIYATHGSNHRILAIAPAQNLLWSREGRRQVFDSHRFR